MAAFAGTNGTFRKSGSTGSFSVEFWTPTHGWGSAATQTIT